jgi:uncharacterized protein YndB with AHSA1/START domain
LSNDERSQKGAAAIGDSVRVETTVAASPARVFEAFTRETDLWWRRGPKYRLSNKYEGRVELTPGVGGELLMHTPRRSFVLGRVLVWEPGARLVLEWRNVNFAEGERTEVEVWFEATPSGKTRVTLEHRGWSAIRPDHPARHGLVGREFNAMMGNWWAGLLASLRETYSN